MEVIDWPYKSPDLNPIEHLWNKMVFHTRDMDNPTTTAAQLYVTVQQAWVALRPVRLKNLVLSMPVECMLLSLRMVVAPTINSLRPIDAYMRQ